MIRVRSTVVAVVGPPGTVPLDGVAGANVRVVAPGPGAALDRAVGVWDEARRTTTPWLLHDADPLADVADAWEAFVDGTGVPGRLEVAVGEVVARWRARSLDLPDHYLVRDADALAPSRRHWYLGVLAGAAPARVVAVAPATPVVDTLAGLRSSPWWPDLDRLLSGVDRVVPDRVGALAPPPPPTDLVVP